MRQPFSYVDDGVLVGLSPDEVELLRALPRILDSVGDDQDDRASLRLNPAVHDDPVAAADYREIVEADLERERTVDRAAFTATLGHDQKLSFEDAEVWIRVIAEARIVLAARVGIEQDGWTHEDFPGDHDAVLVQYLAWLQDGLVASLTPTLG